MRKPRQPPRAVQQCPRRCTTTAAPANLAPLLADHSNGSSPRPLWTAHTRALWPMYQALYRACVYARVCLVCVCVSPYAPPPPRTSHNPNYLLTGSTSLGRCTAARHLYHTTAALRRTPQPRSNTVHAWPESERQREAPRHHPPAPRTSTTHGMRRQAGRPVSRTQHGTPRQARGAPWVGGTNQTTLQRYTCHLVQAVTTSTHVASHTLDGLCKGRRRRRRRPVVRACGSGAPPPPW